VLGVVNRLPRWQHHRTKCHKLRCKICKPFHQILCIRNVLNNKLLRSEYNEIVQWKSVAVWVRFAGIWDKILSLLQSCRSVHNDSTTAPPCEWYRLVSQPEARNHQKIPKTPYFGVQGYSRSLNSHRYWDTATYWPKSANFTYPPFHLAPSFVVIPFEFMEKLYGFWN